MTQANVPSYMVLGKDDGGNGVRIFVVDSGVVDSQGNHIFALGTTPRPLGVLGSYIGSYNNIAAGPMAAGLAGASPIFSFRWSPVGAAFANAVALIKRVTFSLETLGTGFAAGNANIDLFQARGWTVSDTGGAAVTFAATSQGKLRTAYASSLVADFRGATTATLTPGTRTALDARPINSILAGIPVTTNAVLIPATDLINRDIAAGDSPLVIAPNEGIVIQATVPGTGTWSYQVTVEWSEILTY